MVTTDYLDEIIERCSKMTESGGYSTRNMIVMAMKDAVTSGYITYNPSLNTKFYRRPKPKIRILSEEQIKRLLAEAKKTNWYLEILLGLFVGLRKGEILGLKTTDFNEENKTVRVERQIVRDGELVEGSSQLINYKLVEKTPKTDNSIRCLKVPDLIIEELNKRKQVIDINKLSLPHITVHGLRHMCATILLEEGVSLAKISAMLGHTSIHTTFEYYCEVMDEKEKILAFMNNLFSIEDGVEYVG